MKNKKVINSNGRTISLTSNQKVKSKKDVVNKYKDFL